MRVNGQSPLTAKLREIGTNRESFLCLSLRVRVTVANPKKRVNRNEMTALVTLMSPAQSHPAMESTA